MTEQARPCRPARTTIVRVDFELGHPYWRGDGQDEDIAVRTLEDGIARAIGASDSYTIVEVETDE